jgi:Tfp pilus assembly protein PilO
MKVKILMVPLLIAIIVGLLIWLIYPLYSNGTDGVKEKYFQLKKEKQQIANIENKKQNAESLSSQLSSASEKEILYNFVPENIKDEEIIDNLNFLASSKSGLSVLSLSVRQPEAESISENLSASGISADSNVLPIADPGQLLPTPMPQPRNVRANLKVIGSYVNIKNFLISLNSLKRYNGLSSLSIGAASENKEENSSNLLRAEMEINFNILEKVKFSQGFGINEELFSSDQLNLEIISAIKDKKNTDILKLNVETQGRVNPFLP